MAAATTTQRRQAREAFKLSYRKGNFCNWCGQFIENRLIHHGDGIPVNNVPDNLWALCGRSCHDEVHNEFLDGRVKMKAAGGYATAALGGGLKKLHADGFFTPERQSTAGKAGVGESKAKGARVANAKRVKCPDCDRIMNPGSLGMHKRIHLGR